MVSKSSTFPFCLIKFGHMIKVSAQTFFLQLAKVRDLHTVLRFYIRMIILSGRHRNKYSLNHSSLSYIIRRFDFQAKGLKREKET